MEHTHLKQSNICLLFNTTFIGLSAFLNYPAVWIILILKILRKFKISESLKYKIFYLAFLLVHCNNKEATIHFFYQQ